MRKEIEAFLLTQASFLIQKRLSQLGAAGETGKHSGANLVSSGLAGIRSAGEGLLQLARQAVETTPASDPPVCDPKAQLIRSNAYPISFVGPAPVLPNHIVFFDLETTGLANTDRIVSLGAFKMSTERLSERHLDVEYLHLMFNPEKKCHFAARKAHGLDDWTLAHQPRFATFAKTVHEMLRQADMIVAHNAAFDMRFLAQELSAAGLELPDAPVFCTMQAWRAAGAKGSASLDSVCNQLNIRRVSEKHCALEDAALSMSIFMHMHGLDFSIDRRSLDVLPSNFSAPPPRPTRRKRSETARGQP